MYSEIKSHVFEITLNLFLKHLTNTADEIQNIKTGIWTHMRPEMNEVRLGVFIGRTGTPDIFIQFYTKSLENIFLTEISCCVCCHLNVEVRNLSAPLFLLTSVS